MAHSKNIGPLLARVIGCKLKSVLQLGPEWTVTKDGVTGVGTFAALDNGLIVELDYGSIGLVAPGDAEHLVPAEFRGNSLRDPHPKLIFGEKIVALLHSEYWGSAGLLLQNGCVLRSYIDHLQVAWVGPHVDRMDPVEIAECLIFPDMSPLRDHPNLLQLVSSQ